MLCVLCLALAGCDDATPEDDGGIDAGAAMRDAGLDAAVALDAGHDAGGEGDAGNDDDAGSDAGSDDAAIDAGNDDAGTDGGPVMLTLDCAFGTPCVCPPGASCTIACAGGGCRIDCQEDSECAITCSGGCDTTCGERATCSWESSGGGIIWCDADATCTGVCNGGGCRQVCTEPGSSCTISACTGGCNTWCDDATSECELTCVEGCGLSCGSSTMCTSTSTMEPLSCYPVTDPPPARPS